MIFYRKSYLYLFVLSVLITDACGCGSGECTDGSTKCDGHFLVTCYDNTWSLPGWDCQHVHRETCIESVDGATCGCSPGVRRCRGIMVDICNDYDVWSFIELCRPGETICEERGRFAASCEYHVEDEE